MRRGEGHDLGAETGDQVAAAIRDHRVMAGPGPFGTRFGDNDATRPSGGRGAQAGKEDDRLVLQAPGLRDDQQIRLLLPAC